MATRSASKGKTAGIRRKRITGKQRAARRLNIAIARKRRQWSRGKKQRAMKKASDAWAKEPKNAIFKQYE